MISKKTILKNKMKTTTTRTLERLKIAGLAFIILITCSHCGTDIYTREREEAERRAEDERLFLMMHTSRGTRADVEREWNEWQKKKDQAGKREEEKLKRMYEWRASPSGNQEFR